MQRPCTSQSFREPSPPSAITVLSGSTARHRTVPFARNIRKRDRCSRPRFVWSHPWTRRRRGPPAMRRHTRPSLGALPASGGGCPSGAHTMSFSSRDPETMRPSGMIQTHRTRFLCPRGSRGASSVGASRIFTVRSSDAVTMLSPVTATPANAPFVRSSSHTPS